MKLYVDGQELEFDPSFARVTEGSDRLYVHSPAGTISAVVVPLADATLISYGGRQYTVRTSRSRKELAPIKAAGEMRASMPGLVVEIRAKVGESVSKGQVLLVVEAMKTQQPTSSPFEGTVQFIVENTGCLVDEGDLLAIVTAVTDK